MKHLLLFLCSLLLFASTALPQGFKCQTNGGGCVNDYNEVTFYYNGTNSTSGIYTKIASTGTWFRVVSNFCFGETFYCTTETTDLVRVAVTKGGSSTFSATNNVKGTVVIPNGTVYLTVAGGTPFPMTKSGDTYTLDVNFGSTGKAFTITGGLPTASTICGENGLTNANTGLPLTSGALTPASVQLNLTGFISKYASATVTFNLLTNQVTQIQKTTLWISTSTTSINLNYAANSTTTFSISSNTSWSINNSNSWLNISSTSGTGNATITATANSLNNSNTPRTATITLSATGCSPISITVTQAAALQLSASPTSIELGQTANSSKTFSITSNVSWTISNSGNWLNLSTTSGTSNSTITATATSANTSTSPRTATITLSAPNCSPTNISVTQNPNNSLHFDGVDDYVELATQSNGFLNSILKNGFSFTSWVKRESATGSECLLCFAIADNRYSYRLMLDNSTGTLSFESTENNVNFISIATTSANAVSANQWAHIAVTITTTGAAHIYINGNDAATGALVSPNVNGEKPFCYLGRWHISQSNQWATPLGENYFHGAMDEASLWSKVLTQAEISNSLVNEFAGNESGLYFYYKFNQGAVAGANTAITTLTCNGGTHVATLRNFSLALNDTQSNFVAGYSTQNLFNIAATPTTPTLGGEANNTANISITSNTAWSLTSSANWLTLSTTSGVGNGSTTITTNSKNTTGSARTALVTLSAAGAENVIITVTQNAYVPTVTVNSQALQLAAAANSNTSLGITSNADWTITGIPTWLSLSKATGTGNATITVNAVTKHVEYAPRTATLTLSANDNPSIFTTATVTQANEVPILNASASSITLGYMGNSQNSLALTSNASWTITKPADCGWFSLSKTSGSNGAGISVISASENNSCEKRTGTFTISTTDLTPAITVTVTVEQDYKPRTLTVDKESLLVEGNANSSTSVKIASNMNWSISKPSDCNWLTISPATGSNNGTIAITTTSRNTSGAERTTNVVIVPECTSVPNKTITITQSIYKPYVNVYKNDFLPANINGTAKVGFTSNADWTIEENCDWFEVDKLSGSGDGEIIITATLSNNSNANRQAILTFKSPEMSDVVISITQSCILLDATTPTPQQIGMNTGCTGFFSVASNIQWTITNIPSWCTLSSTSGSSNANITITTTEANTTGAPRSAQITLSGVDAESKTITITQGYIDLSINTTTTGSGTEMQQLPVNDQSAYSYSQSIYLQSEINKAGTITKLRFYYTSGATNNGATCNKWDIRMGHTSKTEFSDNSDFFANLVCVYSGDVTFPANEGWIEIPLTTPFTYNNTDNLAIAVYESNPGTTSVSNFSCTAGTNRSIQITSTNPIALDPMFDAICMCNKLYLSGNRMSYTPNIKISFGIDAGIVAIEKPTSSNPGYSDIVAVIKNFGESTLNGFTIKYRINNDMQSLSTPMQLDPGTTTQITLKSSYNFTNSDSYTIKAYTAVNGDANPANDAFVKTIDAKKATATKFNGWAFNPKDIAPRGGGIFNPTSIHVDSQGNTVVTGYFDYTLDFDPSPTAVHNLTSNDGDYDIFIAKYNALGNLLFAKKIGGDGADYAYSSALDANGNIYITGEFNTMADFDPSGTGECILTAASNDCAFFAKYTANGDLVYAKSLNAENAGSEGMSIALDANGNIYLAGEFNSTTDFNPSITAEYLLTAAPQSDPSSVFIAKYTNAGEFIFAKKIGNGSNINVNALALTSTGDIWLTGNYGGTIDFNPDAPVASLTAGGTDIYIAKYDADGNYIFANGLTGNTLAEGTSIAVDANGAATVTGRFAGTVDFDPSASSTSITSAGSWDIFIARYNASGEFQWAKGIGGTEDDEGKSVVQDASGNIYVAGYFYGTVDFSPNSAGGELTSAGNDDMFIAKYAQNGDLINAVNMGGAGSDEIYLIAAANGNIYVAGYFGFTADFDPSSAVNSLTTTSNASAGFIGKYSANLEYAQVGLIDNYSAVDYAQEGNCIKTDNQGNVYVTGYFKGSVDFDPGTDVAALTAAGDADAFIAKYDTDGTLQWVKSMGGSAYEEGKSVAIDNQGNVFVAGVFNETANFGAITLTSNGSSDLFIAKFSPSGEVLFANKIGGSGSDDGISIAVDGDGDIYVAGNFSYTTDFNPDETGVYELTSSNSGNLFIAKYTNNGTFVYAKPIMTYNGYLSSIAVDNAKNIYITGSFSCASFNPASSSGNLCSNGNYDIFFAKYDALGNYLFAKSIGGYDSDYGESIAVDAAQNIYITGYFKSTVDFNPALDATAYLTSKGENDIFFVKYDASGNYVYAKSIGSNGSDYGKSIAVDAAQNVYITGYFNTMADFDPSETGTANLYASSNDLSDIFIARYDADGNYVFAKNLKGVNDNKGYSIALDSDNNIYVTGYFIDRICLATNTGEIVLQSNNDEDIFIAKYFQTPEINVTGNGVNIVSGSTSTSVENSTDFGSVSVGETITKTFTIESKGIGNLLLTNTPSITVTGDGFALKTDAPSIVATGSSATFEISYTASCGVSTGTITINSNDEDEAVYTFAIKGSGVDNIAPVPNVADLPDAKGECSVTVTSPTATDSCKGAITGTTTDPLTYSEQGTYTITWKYDDGNGNIATQTQKVEVKDVTAPTPNISSLPDINGDCSVTVTNIPTATDNCKGTIQATTNSPLSYDAQGTYTIVWTFSDAAGNVTTQNQTVVVKDNTAPVADVISLPEVSGECSASVITAPTATDNCKGTITATTTDPLTYSEQGTFTITWKYDDGNGNIATQTQKVTVNDVTAPVVECIGDITKVIAQTESSYTVSGTEFDPTKSSDNCTVASVTNDFNNQATLANAIFPVGTTVVKWTVTDIAGNSTSCSFTVTVNKANGIFEVKNEISVYPNPVHTKLSITCDSDIKAVKIFNINGQLVINDTFSSRQVILDMQSLKEGTYIVEVETENGKLLQKVIKQ